MARRGKGNTGENGSGRGSMLKTEVREALHLTFFLSSFSMPDIMLATVYTLDIHSK